MSFIRSSEPSIERRKIMSAQGASSPSSGLAPNVASLLCYVCGFITGIVFLVIEKDHKDVRYHAWQSIFLTIAAFTVLLAVSILNAIVGAISTILGALIDILNPVAALGFFILWVVCLIKAYNGERYQLPIIGPLAEKQAMK